MPPLLLLMLLLLLLTGRLSERPSPTGKGGATHHTTPYHTTAHFPFLSPLLFYRFLSIVTLIPASVKSQ